MIDKNLLMKFCKDTDDETIKLPYSIGKFTYATDGMILVRIPRMPEYPENPKAPDPEKIEYERNPKKWYPVNIETPQRIWCRECSGTGIIYHENEYNEYEFKCKSCDGDGNMIPKKPIDFHGVVFDQRYLALLLQLPNCEIGPISRTAATPFRFDGGSGIIMPMRYHDSSQK